MVKKEQLEDLIKAGLNNVVKGVQVDKFDGDMVITLTSSESEKSKFRVIVEPIIEPSAPLQGRRRITYTYDFRQNIKTTNHSDYTITEFIRSKIIKSQRINHFLANGGLPIVYKDAPFRNIDEYMKIDIRKVVGYVRNMVQDGTKLILTIDMMPDMGDIMLMDARITLDPRGENGQLITFDVLLRQE